MPWRVGEHLHLDVPRALDVALDEHAAVAEAGARLGGGALERLAALLGVAGDPHALAAAAGARLEQHRVADPLGRRDAPRRRRRRRRRSRAAIGTPAVVGERACDSILSPIARIAAGGGPMKVTPAAATRLGEVGVLGEEAEAGVDRASAPVRCARRDDRLDVEVGGDRRRRRAAATASSASRTAGLPASTAW